MKKIEMEPTEFYHFRQLAFAIKRFACLFQLWKSTKPSFGLRTKYKSTK